MSYIFIILYTCQIHPSSYLHCHYHSLPTWIITRKLLISNSLSLSIYIYLSLSLYISLFIFFYISLQISLFLSLCPYLFLSLSCSLCSISLSLNLSLLLPQSWSPPLHHQATANIIFLKWISCLKSSAPPPHCLRIIPNSEVRIQGPCSFLQMSQFLLYTGGPDPLFGKPREWQW